MKSIHADLDAFHSGFQACAKEVLQYLSQVENWAAREQRCAQLINHLQKTLAQLQTCAPQPPSQHQLTAADAHDGQKADGQANCVPVIQRTQGGELNENDTDTDSGYGGEAEKSDGKDKETERIKAQGHKAVKVKQEFGDERVAKKPKMNSPGNSLGGADPIRPDLALMNSLMGINSVGQQTPICMPFYFINPSAAASYMPFFDKNNIEKYMYPAAAALTSPFPWLYPAHAAAAAAAAAFPSLSAHLGASSQSNDSRSPDSEESPDAEAGSPEQLQESPARHEGDSDVADAFQDSKNSPHDQLSACQAS